MGLVVPAVQVLQCEQLSLARVNSSRIAGLVDSVQYSLAGHRVLRLVGEVPAAIQARETNQQLEVTLPEIAKQRELITLNRRHANDKGHNRSDLNRIW